MKLTLGWGLCACLAWGATAAAQDRPDEGSLFGGEPVSPADAGETDAGAPPEGSGASEAVARPGESEMFGEKPVDEAPPAERAAAAAAGDRDAEQLSGPGILNQFDTQDAKADPLRVGGLLYQRFLASATDDSKLRDVAFSAPTRLDAFLDSRPSERVRGMVLARLRYEPTLDPSQASGVASLPGSTGTGAVLETTQAANPTIALDQMWLRFDIARTVFVTAGKQHVKWGASRFWNPTDFLTPQRRDPLAVLDVRLGMNMVKLHLPWEAKGWNFYAIGLLDNAGPANALGELGAAGRAEVVLGSTELGVDAVVVRGTRPRYGLDLSTGIGPLDFYGEAALRSPNDYSLWRVREGFDGSQPIGTAFERYTPERPQVLASGGLRTTINYTENNAVTVGGEYFYNPVGTNDPVLYPWLIFNGEYQPFYAARHYAALYALLVGLPGYTNVSASLSTLGNLTDKSFVTRLDVFLLVLSYLNLEAFGAVHYGGRGGEFRFALDVPSFDLGNGQMSQAIHLAAPTADFGVGVRIAL